MFQPHADRPNLSASLALGLAFGALATFAPGAHAAENDADTPKKQTSNLPSIQVDAQAATPYKIDEVSSPRFTQPLRDTPQSITIVPKAVLDEQNAQTLQDVLRNVPGITFMSGEGNLGWGDLFTIRGFSSEQSLTVDGVRDGGMSSRTDTFDLDQVEVYKGTGSVESGVAAVGGSVNLVSKEAKLADFNHVSIGAGSAEYRRLTADINHKLGDGTALRINVMGHRNGVVDRDTTDYDRRGVAASLGFGLDGPTHVYIDGFHQRDRNVPDGGIPIQRGTHGDPMPGVPRSAWYGAAGIYTQQTASDSLTLKIEHEASDDVHLRNQTRWQRTDNFSALSPARFFSAGANGKKTCTGPRCATLGYIGVGPLSNASGVPSYTGFANLDNQDYGILRGNDFGTSTRYTMLDNQSDVTLHFNTGTWKHDLVTGIELYRESYGGLARNAYVPAGDLWFNLSDPSHDFPGTWTRKGLGQPRSTVTDAAAYVSDTITLAPQWQALASLRYDYWQARTTQVGTKPTRSDDGAWSGRAGVVYKPVEPGSIYVSYSQAAEPSALGATTNNLIYGSVSTNAYTPAKSSTWELGSKWDLLDGQLGLTGAVFRTQLSNSWEYQEGETSPVRALPAKRVDGFELGAQGQLSDRWSIFAGLSRLISRQTKGANEGLAAKNVPGWSGNLWTTYAVTPDLSLSYGAQYVGKQRFSDNRYVGGQNNNSSYAVGPSGVYPIYVLDTDKAPSYWVHSLAARYRVNDHLHLNLSVNNLFNTFYYARIGASLDGFQLYGVPGAGRTTVVSADLSF
ncbi:TonB-dependent siderophore receptor [Rothia nasimurium]|uniref:TonB-dependent siderophore receptor n=1 Tax=Luteibacter anthropi TaxID=564369 RepID=A0A7X5ZHA4_9GAMM|nr:TonB-dependent siderophore receptor [Luteibacter anthropi]NII05375.1 TonB-dependent siderophore receptor [Luteibacter anthropi]